ncbi:hypothetical protein MMPV_006650 [Pyropia vietnamensis]
MSTPLAATAAARTAARRLSALHRPPRASAAAPGLALPTCPLQRPAVVTAASATCAADPASSSAALSTAAVAASESRILWSSSYGGHPLQAASRHAGCGGGGPSAATATRAAATAAVAATAAPRPPPVGRGRDAPSPPAWPPAAGVRPQAGRSSAWPADGGRGGGRGSGGGGFGGRGRGGRGGGYVPPRGRGGGGGGSGGGGAAGDAGGADAPSVRGGGRRGGRHPPPARVSVRPLTLPAGATRTPRQLAVATGTRFSALPAAAAAAGVPWAGPDTPLAGEDLELLALALDVPLEWRPAGGGGGGRHVGSAGAPTSSSTPGGGTGLVLPGVDINPEAALTSAARASLPQRPPVVALVGHVDHGKTTLLDALRSMGAPAEVGGITQAIGAFMVDAPVTPGDGATDGLDGGSGGARVTFLDTPGHAAFAAMRASGVAAADLAVLVVAADDGVMPQTVEAAAAATAAGVPIVVALTKMDAPGADAGRARAALLSETGIHVVSLGGDVPDVEVVAPAGRGLPDLLVALTDVAETAALVAPAGGEGVSPRAVVVEAAVDKRLGPTAAVVVRWGTLRVGDWVVAVPPPPPGTAAGPSVPALVVGLGSVLPPGTVLVGAADAKDARRLARAAREAAEGAAAVAAGRAEAEAEGAAADAAAADAGMDADANADADAAADADGVSTEAARPSRPPPPRLNIVIKGDVQGTTDAVAALVDAIAAEAAATADAAAEAAASAAAVATPDSLPPPPPPGAHFSGHLHGHMDRAVATLLPTSSRSHRGGRRSGGGGSGPSAAAAVATEHSIVLAFNVGVDGRAAAAARRAGVQVLSHTLIYKLEDDLRAAIAAAVDEAASAASDSFGIFAAGGGGGGGGGGGLPAGVAAVVRAFEGGAVAGATVGRGRVRLGDAVRVSREVGATGGTGGSGRTRSIVATGVVGGLRRYAADVEAVKKGQDCGVRMAGQWADFREGDRLEFFGVG